ncbi:4Fe-4S binding protein [Fusibacter sp. JL216-2]|uniref:4Fe-4S binding protein n=1 Tax=Fusibacter sp. JL216-2 TaxID=3071453 RepID=UPI003D331A67
MHFPKTPNIHQYADNKQLVKHGPLSKHGHDVPDIMLKYGRKRSLIPQRLPVIKDLIRSLHESKISYKSLANNPIKGKRHIDEATLSSLRQMIIDLDCHAIGFTKVDPSLIFINKGILYSNAIVITMEMQADKMDTAPSKACVKEVFRTYKELGIIVNKVAHYLRQAGFSAQAGPAIGGDTNYPLLAQKAGLGHLGRHGLLISPKVGPRQRIAVIYTDIDNLPFTDSLSKEHDWIEAFCQRCRRCQRACPANAIYDKIKLASDGSKQHIDYKKCALPFSSNYGCSVCIKACTFNSQDYDTIKKKMD